MRVTPRQLPDERDLGGGGAHPHRGQGDQPVLHRADERRERQKIGRGRGVAVTDVDAVEQVGADARDLEALAQEGIGALERVAISERLDGPDAIVDAVTVFVPHHRARAARRERQQHRSGEQDQATPASHPGTPKPGRRRISLPRARPYGANPAWDRVDHQEEIISKVLAAS